MIPRRHVSILGSVVAATLVSAPALAQAAEFAPPATHSPLDPIRLAADFAPTEPAAPEVVPFELVAADSGTALVDSVSSPPDSLPPASPGTTGPPIAPGPAVVVEQPSIVAPVIGSLIAGAAGLYGGALLGASIFGGDDNNEYDEYGGAILGGIVGEVFLMPVGAHLGNGSQGSYWSAFGGSSLGFVATLALSYLGPVGGAVGVALQTALTVSGERRSAKRRAAEQSSGMDPGESASP
jgi:hypothetical protein